MGSAGGTLEHAGTEPVPIAGNVAYIILAMVNSAVLAVFLSELDAERGFHISKC